jgi:2-keto-4-pentenoate hydratase/2-oxohepta-3-ene-1,7-dioic acid hydratase in catechol pathway
VTWLEPGDVIATGTPDGVGLGRKPPLWMKTGDNVEVEISGIGTLSVNVVDE